MKTTTVMSSAQRRANRCPWCQGAPDGYRFQATQSGSYDGPDTDYRTCSHPAPVVIRALPGAEFRVTKYQFTDNSDRRLTKLHPTWTAPRDVGAAFRKACLRPIPKPEDVT
jgi:hypothetical protein